MTSTPVETDIAPSPISLERIGLANGWTARILTSAGERTSSEVNAPALPSESQWVGLLSTLVDDPGSLPGYEVLKYSKTAQVFRATLVWDGSSLDVVCKQSFVRGWRRILPAKWRRSRERRDFDRGFALLRARLPTAWPLALLEGRARTREAKLLTTFVRDAVDLDQVALMLLPQLAAKRARRVKDQLIVTLADLIFQLQAHGLFHRDLKASNVLLTHWNRETEPPQLWLVDLEGIQRVRPGSGKSWRMLVRLGASLIGYTSVTRGDYARFLRHFLTRFGQPGEAWKTHYRGLSQRAAAYLRRAKARKTHKLDGYQ